MTDGTYMYCTERNHKLCLGSEQSRRLFMRLLRPQTSAKTARTMAAQAFKLVSLVHCTRFESLQQLVEWYVAHQQQVVDAVHHGEGAATSRAQYGRAFARLLLLAECPREQLLPLQQTATAVANEYRAIRGVDHVPTETERERMIPWQQLRNTVVGAGFPDTPGGMLAAWMVLAPPRRVNEYYNVVVDYGVYNDTALAAPHNTLFLGGTYAVCVFAVHKMQRVYGAQILWYSNPQLCDVFRAWATFIGLQKGARFLGCATVRVLTDDLLRWTQRNQLGKLPPTLWRHMFLEHQSSLPTWSDIEYRNNLATTMGHSLVTQAMYPRSVTA